MPTSRPARLWTRVDTFGFAEPAHYLFPWHGRDKKIDPTRPMEAWRTAGRSIRKAAGLDHVRFHDGRHTALTRLAEKGQPDWVIQAQMGHASPAMMKDQNQSGLRPEPHAGTRGGPNAPRRAREARRARLGRQRVVEVLPLGGTVG